LAVDALADLGRHMARVEAWHESAEGSLHSLHGKLERIADACEQGLDVQQVVSVFQAAATHTNILVLDACRDNPFACADSGGPRGLAPMDAPL
jgi:hypothetical protein